jgi:hypothetical protein
MRDLSDRIRNRQATTKHLYIQRPAYTITEEELAQLELQDAELRAEIKAALEGDSNDAEHDALASVASTLGIEYRDPDDVLEDDN